MSRYRKWALTLGIMAVTPTITLAGPPSLPFLKSAAAERKTESNENQQVADAVASALRSARLSGIDIGIEHRDGVTTLSGTAVSADVARRAAEIVGKVPGVLQVDNQLKVAGRDVRPVGYEQTATAERPQSRTGGASNQAVAQEVADALSKAGLSGYDMEIRCTGGTAILSGVVRTEAHRAKAEQLASRVPGVVSVDNRLSVLGSRPQIRQTAYQEPGQMPPQAAPGMPAPNGYALGGPNAVPAAYNMPNVPDYAWPAYAAYPNSAAVTYPKDYSASAWPYIGPFYPYPQVPLDWRKATLEWDDGEWKLNFNDRTDKWFWFLNPKNW